MNTLILAATLSLQFLGPCSSKPLLETKARFNTGDQVGKLTIDTLENFEVPYQGTEQGLNAAFGTPTGLDAMEVISDSEMRSYGWCFNVDGKVTETYPSETYLAEGTKNVTWFFAYAHYKNGEWISQCEPAHKIKPAFICQE
jgi:hypothetical protein